MNPFDAEELANIRMSQRLREAAGDRWINILLDAGEFRLAADLAFEMRENARVVPMVRNQS